MNETLTTVRGTIVTAPRTRNAGTETVVSLRLACNNRYQDRETKEWKTSSTLYLTVSCWGHLAGAVGGRLCVGDAVIVTGRLSTNEYTQQDGNKRSDVEMRAVAIGPDMGRHEVTIKHRSRATGESTQSAPTDDQAVTEAAAYGEEPDDTDGDHTRDASELVGAGSGHSTNAWDTGRP